MARLQSNGAHRNVSPDTSTTPGQLLHSRGRGRERRTNCDRAHRVTARESKRPSITEGAGAALARLQHSHPSLLLPLKVDLSLETMVAVICTNALMSTSHVMLWVWFWIRPFFVCLCYPLHSFSSHLYSYRGWMLLALWITAPLLCLCHQPTWSTSGLSSIIQAFTACCWALLANHVLGSHKGFFCPLYFWRF